MHEPVLLQAVIDGLHLSPGATVIDATVGGGGHSRVILERTAPDGVVVGFDRDRTALLYAAEQLEEYGERFVAIHDSYAQLAQHQDEIMSHAPVMGILADLGLSSLQLDDPDRGFAFRYNGPLDMRFDQSHGPTAADLLNSQPEEELRMLLWEYGEEPSARRIAHAIVEERVQHPLDSTDDLLHVIERVVKRRPGQRIHPATRTFQALRIAVNHELEQLTMFLPQAVALLAPGGRLAVISFHSLEDRIVKQFFKREATDCLCAPESPICQCGHTAALTLITRKPIAASPEEIQSNPRARSAKLRIIEKK